jgi:hypothetical protein
MKAEYFCDQGLDSPNQIESVQQITVYVDAISRTSKSVQRSDF